MPKNLRVVFYVAILAIVTYAYFNDRPVPPAVNVRLEAPPASPAIEAPALPVAEAPKVPMPDFVVADSRALDVRRDEIQTAFERAPFRLTFDYQPYADGRSRMMGFSADRATRLELIGPPEKLHGLALTADMTETNRLAQLRNLNALGNAAKLTNPTWADASGWITANVALAFQNGRAETTMNGNLLKLAAVPNSKLMVLTITGPAN
ncbi:MAG: hypothetical protein FJX59_05930 [Alphaproteobacteria bacterium]|nr:hypothetical protein [Alphaproteobacteria bacterium]